MAKCSEMNDEMSSKPKLKILFYGAGVLGSLYAARLQKAGHDVSILARGQRLAELSEHGIVLEEIATGKQTTTHVNVIERLEPEAVFDLVIVLMRKNQVSEILPVLAENRHTPNILFMVNNAAGPGPYITAVGRSRVVLGFANAGGIREEHIVRYSLLSFLPSITLGELNGAATSRLKWIGALFKEAGLAVAFSRNMDAWLRTHVALISPGANALYLAGGDSHRLARTRDGLVLFIRAIREGFKVLGALSIPITPGWYRIFVWLPEPVLVAVLRLVFGARLAETSIAGHANAARDEMVHLADEFKELARITSLSTPAIDQLYTYADPATPPMAEGSSQLPMVWNVGAVWARR